MANIEIKIKFGKEDFKSLIDEIVKDKICVITNKLKNRGIKDYSFTNVDKKVDEIK